MFIRQNPRQLSFPKRAKTKKAITSMANDGVKEPSQSPRSIPFVIVKKKNSSTRCCVDYRQLNKETINHSYPLARNDDTLEPLTGLKWFSTLGFKSYL